MGPASRPASSGSPPRVGQQAVQRRIDYRRLLDGLSTAVLLLDGDLRICLVNPAAESLLGMSSRQAVGLCVDELLADGGEDVAAITQALAKRNGYTKRRSRLGLPHGKITELDYTVTPIDCEGELLALLEMNSLEHSQRIDRDQLLSSTRTTTRELLRGLAHEIKNPLGGLRGAAQLLERELPDAGLAEYTSVIISEADRLRNLVERLTGHRKTLERRHVNIHEVVERVRNLVEAELDGQGIRLVRDYDPSIPTLLADPEQLIQALLNIARNAVQSLSSPVVHHDLGKIVLRTRATRNVAFGQHSRHPAISVEVIDNGPGIPERLGESILFPMVTGRAEGMGLGLPIAHAIVSEHHGLLEYESEPGRTCFRLLLPYQMPYHGATAAPEQTEGEP